MTEEIKVKIPFNSEGFKDDRRYIAERHIKMAKGYFGSDVQLVFEGYSTYLKGSKEELLDFSHNIVNVRNIGYNLTKVGQIIIERVNEVKEDE